MYKLVVKVNYEIQVSYDNTYFSSRNCPLLWYDFSVFFTKINYNGTQERKSIKAPVFDARVFKIRIEYYKPNQSLY